MGGDGEPGRRGGRCRPNGAAVADHCLTRRQAMEWCQRFKALAGGGFEITMPDKLRAIELDAKLAGELREKVDVAAEFKDLREAGINPMDVSPVLLGIARGRRLGGEVA